MRITFVTRYNVKCGIATYSNFLLKKLSKICKLKIVKINMPAPNNPFYWINLAKKAHSNSDLIHIQFHYEIFGKRSIWVIINSIFFFYTLFILNLFKKVSIVMTFHEADDKNKKVVKYTDFIYRFILDAIIVHTKDSEIKFKERGYKYIYIIPHGFKDIVKKIDNKKCKNNLKLINKNILTIFGFVHHLKNHKFLIKLMPKLPPNYFLLIAGGCRTIGEKPYWDEINKIAKKYAYKIKFLDFIEEKNMPKIFNATDIFLFPYKKVTQSGALAEVFAYHKPCIVSKQEAFLEINKQSKCLEIVPLKESEWIKKIIQITDNKQYRNNLINNMKKYIQKTNWKTISNLHKEVYKKIIDKINHENRN